MKSDARPPAPTDSGGPAPPTRRNGRLLRTPAALALASLFFGACSAENGDPPPFATGSEFDEPRPLELRPDAVKADQHFSDTATVEDGKVTVPVGAADPTGSNEAVLAKLKVGSVLAGNRDTASAVLASSKNAYGFLRRVLEIERRADEVVLHTQQAYLDELFSEGDLVWDAEHPRGSIFDETGGGLIKQSLKPLANNGAGSNSGSGQVAANAEIEDTASDKSVKFRPKVSLSNARVGMDAKFTGELKIRKVIGIPLGVKRASARLDLDPVVSADLTYGVKVQSTSSALGGALHGKWESPSLPIPIGGPIPLTVRLRAEVTCSVMAAGTITATSRVSLRGHTAAGFKYDGGFDIDPIYEPPTLEAAHDFLGVTGKASLIGECAVQGVVSLLAFDAVGLEGAVGPFAALHADACVTGSAASGVSGGFTLWEQHGLRVDVDGRLQVPGLGSPSVTKDLFGFKPLKSDPKYFVGSKETCKLPSKDSCVDKPNGLYCSELATYSAYQCESGQIVSGQQCAPGKTCSGPNGSGTKIQCK